MRSLDFMIFSTIPGGVVFLISKICLKSHYVLTIVLYFGTSMSPYPKSSYLVINGPPKHLVHESLDTARNILCPCVFFPENKRAPELLGPIWVLYVFSRQASV